MTPILLYLNTVRYLKPKQIFWRLLFKLTSPKLKISKPPHLRKISGKWSLPISKQISLINETTFSFLNLKGSLSNHGWDDPKMEKLWRYNQHYFDDLTAANTNRRTLWHVKLLKLWIKENPPSFGSGWEPYPTSLRIVNWIKWHFSQKLLDEECLESLATQTRWLFSRIEWHIMGNHLFSNAKALVFAGFFFQGEESKKWLERGLDIIKKELPEQILNDGGNFERSPMYHALFLEDLMDLINLSKVYPNMLLKKQEIVWRETAKRMMSFLRDMCHPDGEISFFNDSSIGIAAPLSKLTSYGERISVKANNIIVNSEKLSFQHYPDTGYIRLQGHFAVALLDTAPIGPDYLPGHAHSDTLSFELSLFNKRIIVNGGTSEYKKGKIRTDERSTKSHNTVEVDKENSSEVWSSFRVARRAYPINLKIKKNYKSINVSCMHNGYLRLPGKVLHKRKWKFSKNRLLIEDKVFGKFKRSIARFYLHPEIEIVKKETGLYLLKVDNKKVWLNLLSGEGKIVSGFYAPEFGRRLKTNCLMVDFSKKLRSIVELSWGE